MAKNRKQTERKPVEGGHGWSNENAATLDLRTLEIPGGAVVRLTIHETTLPLEFKTPRSGTKAQDLHRLIMGGTRIRNNTAGGGNGMRGATGAAAATAVGHQQCAAGGGKGGYGMVSADRGLENVWSGSDNIGVFGKTTEMVGRYWGGGQRSAPRLKYKRWKRQICGYLLVW